MQINFTAKKLKEASQYVDLLNLPHVKKEKKPQPQKKISLLKKLFKLLFK